jgi:hypothetical protein
MSNLFKALQTKDTYTTNGMAAHSTTSDYLLDFFGTIGGMRDSDEQTIVSKFGYAFNQEPLLAMKALFHTRNIIDGMGERRSPRLIIKNMATANVDSLRKNLHLIPLYGRWDDLLELVDTPMEADAFGLIAKALQSHDALCAKWMPRPSGNKRNKYIANKLRNFMGLTPKVYRLVLSSITKVVENQMCAKQFGDINYSHVPSVASLRYRKAFRKRDTARYEEYLEALKTGKDGVKVNAKALFPHQIVQQYEIGSHNFKCEFNTDELLEAQWNALPNFMSESSKQRVIPVCDVSGSMNGLPLLISLSLGIYISERNESVFKNGFLTFSDSPKLQYLNGKTLGERLHQLARAEWGMSTNLEATFELILRKGVDNNLTNNDMPTQVLIISDMQFNQATRRYDTALEMIRRKYVAHGFTMPTIVFWNVNGSNNVPVKADDAGTMLVSGYSTSILKYILNSESEIPTPRDLMLQVLNSERYSQVTI